MNVVPKNPLEFSSELYWQKFFQKTYDPFEWYGRVVEYRRIFEALNLNCKILQVGCGNSELEFDMYAEGYTKIHSIDINEQVIAEKKKTAIPGLTYAVADILNFDGEDNSYDAIIDKGTFDALCPTENCQNYPVVDTMFKNCMRVLKPNGKYFIITLSQNQNLKPLEAIFNNRRDFGFIVHTVDVHDGIDDTITLPASLFEITKLRQAFPVQIPISLYFVDSPGAKPVKMDVTKITDSLSRRRQMYMFFSLCKNPLKTPAMIDFNTDNNELRWRFWVVDGPCENIYTFSFLVLSLKIQEFSKYCNTSVEILKEYRKQVDTDRVVIAEQQLDQKYGSHEDISKELQKFARHFMTKTCNFSAPVHYITTDTGKKTVLFTGKTKTFGDFEVHNAFLDKATTVRRLIFINTPSVIQSDCLVKKKDAKDDDYLVVDKLNINNDYEAAMAAGLVFRYGSVESLEHKELDIVIIGIGGGTLPTFLHTVFENFKFTCIELIPEFFEMAKKYFSYPHQSNRVKSVVMDGLDWLNDDTNAQVDVLFIDVGGNDDDDSLVSYPPSGFNTLPVLLKYRERVHERGLVIVNIFITDETMRYELLSKFQAVFDNVVMSKFGFNYVLVASHYNFTPRKQYSSRIISSLKSEHQVLVKKLSSFAALQVPKKYRIPKISVVEKQKKGSKDRQKKGNAGQHKKKAIKP